MAPVTEITDCCIAPEPQVFRAVNLSHTAATEWLDADFIVSQSLADHRHAHLLEEVACLLSGNV